MEKALPTKPEEKKRSHSHAPPARAPRAGVEAGGGPSAGMPLFLKGPQAAEPAASTTDGVTTFRPAAQTHPRAPEIEAHEAVHRAQFVGSAPRGSRVELEQDAQRGAQTLLAGGSYAPAYSAPPGQTLNFESVPLMPDIEASGMTNATSLSTLGDESDRRGKVNTSSSNQVGQDNIRTIQYHIDASGSGRRGTVGTATDISVTYDPGDPLGWAATKGKTTPLPGYGELGLGPAVPVLLYPVVIRYNRRLHLSDADGRDVTVMISSNVNFTRESWAEAISGKPLTFDTLMDLRGDKAEVSVLIDGTGPLQPYFATFYFNGVSLNIQSAVAEISLQGGAGIIPFTSSAPASFVRPELTAGAQFDSLEAFLVAADAIELARRAELERQRREEIGLFGRFLEDSGLDAALDWLGDLIGDMWNSLPAPARGVLIAIGKFAVGVAVIVGVAALVVAATAGSVTLGVATLIVGAVALGVAFVASVYSRYKEASAAGLDDPMAVVSAAVLDTVGLGGFIEALTDDSLLTGRPLNRTEEERWEGGTTGFLQMLATAFGIRGALRGGGAGGGKGIDLAPLTDQGQAPPLLLRDPILDPIGPAEPTVPVEPMSPGTTAVPTTGAYGQMAGKLPKGIQANHINQNAAFESVIPKNEGVAVGMRGNAITEPGTPHYEFHRSLERFWDQFRPGGARAGQTPTCGEYGTAANEALQAGGFTPAEAAAIEATARANRQSYGLSDADPVPRVPGRMGQKK
jgi:hypothetical protein